MTIPGEIILKKSEIDTELNLQDDFRSKKKSNKTAYYILKNG